MTQYVICPTCRKTMCMTGNNAVCSSCGQPLDINFIRKNNLVIDVEKEALEFMSGKDYFVNTEFLGASEHFKKALNANANSYLSLYFVMLCETYLNESSPDYDVMAQAVATIKEPLAVMSRANIKADERLKFILSILTETKIIMINRLRKHDALYDIDPAAYRKAEIADLQTLLQLFKTDDELLMTYSPDVKSILIEIADTAIAVCHKAVQTVAVGGDLFSPTGYEYNRLLSLNNDFGFFAQSFDPSYDVKKYTPDFTQNHLLNEKVQARFDKYDNDNKVLVKKHLVSNIVEYEEILSECEKAMTFTHLSCFRSMCDPNYEERHQLLLDGLGFLYRLLTPRVVITDKKPVFSVGKSYYINGNCEMLTKFLKDVAAFDSPENTLHEYYEKLCYIVETYMLPEFERNTKIINKLKETKSDSYTHYERFLYELACATSPALAELVQFDDGTVKGPRAKLVKYCQKACEDFLMLHDYRIEEIEQSNAYGPLLNIYNSVMKEIGL